MATTCFQVFYCRIITAFQGLPTAQPAKTFVLSIFKPTQLYEKYIKCLPAVCN